MRLARVSGTSADIWMNLQAHYELELERDALEAQIQREVETAFIQRGLALLPV